MAKKAAKSDEVWNEKQPGVPAKQCPQCQKWHHPRRKVCPGCGHEYPQKTKVRRGRKKRDEVAVESGKSDFNASKLFAAAETLLNEAGNVGTARAALDSFAQLIKRLGK